MKEHEDLEETDSAIESERSSLRSNSSESSLESESKEIETEEDFGIDEDTEDIEEIEDEPVKKVKFKIFFIKKYHRLKTGLSSSAIEYGSITVRRFPEKAR